MSFSAINIGTTANDGTGDSARAVGTKLNAMLTELYSITDSLGTAATTNSTAYATAAQGVKADTALQPGSVTTNATHTGDVTGATALTIANNAVSDAKLRDSTGFSVIGKASTGTGDPADIVASDTNGVLGRTAGGNLTFAPISTTNINDNAVTNAKLATVATNTIKGRVTTASGVVEDLTPAQTITVLTSASGGGTTNFLRADGTWAAPPGGGGGVGVTDGDKGDITVSSSGAVWTIEDFSVPKKFLDSVALNFGTTTRGSLSSDGTNTILGIVSGKLRIDDNGSGVDVESDNFTVKNGATTTSLLEVRSTGSSKFFTHVIPDAQNTRDLGSSTARWRTLYTNTIDLAGVSLDGTSLADPNADALVTWDDSAAAGSELGYGTWGQGLTQVGRNPQLTDNVLYDSIQIMLGDGSTALGAGFAGFVDVPWNATIIEATLLAKGTGSCVVDIWKDTFTNHEVTSTDTICASARPTITSSNKYKDAVLTGWNKTLTVGDVLGFNLVSASTITMLTISLRVKKS